MLRLILFEHEPCRTLVKTEVYFLMFFFLDCLHVDVIVYRNNFEESCQSKNIELFNHLLTVQTRINV